MSKVTDRTRAQVQHGHAVIDLRRALRTRGLDRAVDALEFAGAHHIGTRKDDLTPAFDHPVRVARLALDTVCPHLPAPRHDTLVAVALLHDVIEDCGIDPDTMACAFGGEIARAVAVLSKRGPEIAPMPVEGHFHAIADHRLALLVKPCDRAHNLATLGVFDAAKQARIIDQTTRLLIPALRHGQFLHPDLTDAVDAGIAAITQHLPAAASVR